MASEQFDAFRRQPDRGTGKVDRQHARVEREIAGYQDLRTDSPLRLCRGSLASTSLRAKGFTR